MGPEVWPGLRREHGLEKPGARNVARTEARARFREAKSILIGKKLWYSDDRSDSNSWGGALQGPEVWPGLRREHGPEKPGARNVARTEARARLVFQCFQVLELENHLFFQCFQAPELENHWFFNVFRLRSLKTIGFSR